MHHQSYPFYIYQVKRVPKDTISIFMQPCIINLVHFICINSREYQRILLEYLCSLCAKLEDSYTLNEKAGLYLAANGEYVFRKVVQKGRGQKGVTN